MGTLMFELSKFSRSKDANTGLIEGLPFKMLIVYKRIPDVLAPVTRAQERGKGRTAPDAAQGHIVRPQFP
jgi:hypothetical protein